MKFQLCKFLRKKPTSENGGIILKRDLPWERGLARLRSFNDGDVDFIIDEEGKKVGSVYNYQLVNELAYSAIDTEMVWVPTPGSTPK